MTPQNALAAALSADTLRYLKGLSNEFERLTAITEFENTSNTLSTELNMVLNALRQWSGEYPLI